MLTSKGNNYFESIGIEINKIKTQPGIFIKPCLDWTEKTFHLGGNLGKAFFILCVRENFIVSNSENRSVSLTSSGENFFCHLILKIFAIYK